MRDGRILHPVVDVVAGRGFSKLNLSFHERLYFVTTDARLEAAKTFLFLWLSKAFGPRSLIAAQILDSSAN